MSWLRKTHRATPGGRTVMAMVLWAVGMFFSTCTKLKPTWKQAFLNRKQSGFYVLREIGWGGLTHGYGKQGKCSAAGLRHTGHLVARPRGFSCWLLSPFFCGPPPRLRGSGVGLSNGGSSLRDAPCFEIYFLVSIKVLRWLMLGASAAWTDVGLSLPGS